MAAVVLGSTLSGYGMTGYGMTGYGTAATSGSRKIDYLFVAGKVRPSPVGHTVADTKSHHRALYGFIDF